MNLIEKLGLEKCKKIVEGANGITATHYQNGDYLEKWLSTSWVRFVGDQLIDVAIPSTKNLISIADLRTEIANHERTDNCTDIKNHISPNTKVIER